VINKADTEYNFGDKGYLSFEHITWVSSRLCINLFLAFFCGIFILWLILSPFVPSNYPFGVSNSVTFFHFQLNFLMHSQLAS
jgi:hypothetical protein